VSHRCCEIDAKSSSYEKRVTKLQIVRKTDPKRPKSNVFWLIIETKKSTYNEHHLTEGAPLFVPKEIFLVKGVGKERERLASFEMALRDAGIAEYNLVKVTSIFPPKCKVIAPSQGVKKLSAGQILYVVLAESSTNEPNRLIAASIGVAIPRDPNQYGYLSEHHSYGETNQKVGEYAEDLAAYMLSTTLGISFEEDVSYDSRKDLWKIKKEIVSTRNITQTAVGEKNGLWTTAIAAAVLLD